MMKSFEIFLFSMKSKNRHRKAGKKGFRRAESVALTGLRRRKSKQVLIDILSIISYEFK